MSEAILSQNPARAAIELRKGSIVDYQPGDGTRYECVLAFRSYGKAADIMHDGVIIGVDKWLIVRNLKICLDLSRKLNLISFCLAPNTRGTWAALRPVLAALDALAHENDLRTPATGLYEYDPMDAKLEANTRVGYDGTPINEKDARLGRLIRNQIEAGA